MKRDTTIRVARIDGYPAIKMVWEQRVIVDDVGPAFMAIVEMLDASDEPLFVLVDITSRPLFPLAETMTQALAGPYRHPGLLEWLVVGGTSQARIIEEFLSRVTGRENVRWFHSEEAALMHIEAQTKGRPEGR